MIMAAPAPLSREKLTSVLELTERWKNIALLQQDAVDAFANKDKVEGHTLFITIIAFLARQEADEYKDQAQSIANAALALALSLPRLELLDWLDETNLLFNFEGLADRVTACHHQEVHLWFKRRQIDVGVETRFVEPVAMEKRQRTPFSEMLAPVGPTKATTGVRIEEITEKDAFPDRIAKDEELA
jgi:hypothetical protein